MTQLADKQKYLVAIKLLKERGQITVSFDPRREGTSGMDRTRQQCDILIGPRDAASDGVRAECTDASGRKATIVVPWSAVFFLVCNGDPASGRAWPTDFPPELAQQLSERIYRDTPKSGTDAKVVDLAAYRSRKAAWK